MKVAIFTSLQIQHSLGYFELSKLSIWGGCSIAEAGSILSIGFKLQHLDLKLKLAAAEAAAAAAGVGRIGLVAPSEWNLKL